MVKVVTAADVLAEMKSADGPDYAAGNAIIGKAERQRRADREAERRNLTGLQFICETHKTQSASTAEAVMEYAEWRTHLDMHSDNTLHQTSVRADPSLSWFTTHAYSGSPNDNLKTAEFLGNVWPASHVDPDQDVWDMLDGKPIVTGNPTYLRLLEFMTRLHVAKAAGYSGEGSDTWQNFREANAWGISDWQGCCIRLGDKYRRLQNILRNPKLDMLNGEGAGRTAVDLAAYALILVCLLEELAPGTVDAIERELAS